MTSVSPRDTFLHAALELGCNDWQLIPLWPQGKNPRIPNPHPKGSLERQTCKGECGQHGHGVLDATSDLGTIGYWWGVLYPGSNIGARVPENVFALDIDPRSNGHESLAALILDHGPLPETLTTISGRCDGGAHYFYRKPLGPLTSTRLGPGIDLKTSAGYTVHAPSIHPDTGKPYRCIDRPIVCPPDWLIELVTPELATVTNLTSARSRRQPRFWSSSIADDFCDSMSWVEILEPHGWTCSDADPDGDGATWLHPTHTSDCSATIRHDCLFVYSTNTPFEITEPSNPNGYSKFRAYAVLNHDGDMSAAAQTLSKELF